MEEKEAVERGCFEVKSIGEKQEFRVMTVSHWLPPRGGGEGVGGGPQFLVGDAIYILLPIGACH